jgi:hypothetical protein
MADDATEPITDDEVALWISVHSEPGVTERLDEHKVMTPRELAHAVGIRPQVIYNYLKTERIGFELNSSGKKVIPRDEVYEYLRARLTKEQAKAERIIKELRGIT